MTIPAVFFQKYVVVRWAAFLLLFLVIISMFTGGCALSQVRSFSYLEKNHQLKKCFLVFYYIEQSSPFVKSFSEELAENMQRRNVTFNYFLAKRFDTTRQPEINERIANTNSEVLIIITQLTGVTFNSSTASGTFDVKMFIPGSDKPIWRASMTTRGGVAAQKVPRKAVADFVQRLEVDGFLY